MLRRVGIEYQIATPTALNRKWCRPMIRPAGESVANDASSAVIVVPILAPRVIGNALRSVTTPAAIMGTSTEVVMLDDWTRTVITVPMRMAETPPPFMRTALMERSMRPAMSSRMFLVT